MDDRLLLVLFFFFLLFGNVNLPYYAGTTEPLADLMRSKGFSTTFNSRGSLREVLVHPKDELPEEEKTGIVYHIPCAGANGTSCPGRYVGETERTATARFQEHTSTSTNALGKYKSAMLQHARETQHHFRKEDISILTSEHDWVKRGIKEAIFIKALSPSINIDPGRHQLSDHFDSILAPLVAQPSPPAPHDPDQEQLINTAPRRPGRPRSQPTLSQPSPSTVQFAPPAITANSQPQDRSGSGHSSQRPVRQSLRIRDRQQSQTPT